MGSRKEVPLPTRPQNDYEMIFDRGRLERVV